MRHPALQFTFGTRDCCKAPRDAQIFLQQPFYFLFFLFFFSVHLLLTVTSSPRPSCINHELLSFAYDRASVCIWFECFFRGFQLRSKANIASDRRLPGLDSACLPQISTLATKNNPAYCHWVCRNYLLSRRNVAEGRKATKMVGQVGRGSGAGSDHRAVDGMST